MKKISKYIQIILFFILLNIAATAPAVAQGDPPPPPPSGHGETGNVPGGGAPVGSGLLILGLLGAGYGAKKWNDRRKISAQ
ncbi:MAG: hypothetical protein ACLFPE_13475 [Bacteroidales bacterium]